MIVYSKVTFLDSLAIHPLEFRQHFSNVGKQGLFSRREGGAGLADGGCLIKHEAEFQIADSGHEVP